MLYYSFRKLCKIIGLVFCFHSLERRLNLVNFVVLSFNFGGHFDYLFLYQCTIILNFRSAGIPYFHLNFNQRRNGGWCSC
jgi:hypothetical protein